MSKFRIDRIASNFERVKKDLPLVIGNMGQNFFRRSFDRQGFTDNTFKAWKEVKRRIPDTPEYKYPKKGAADRHSRAILIGKRTSGGIHLRDSVNRSLKKATFDSILFSVPQVYAAAHNYGLRVKNFTMPQRKFMGHSRTLLNMVEEKINKSMSRLNR